MEKDPLNRWCPNTQCSRVIRLFSLNENEAVCPDCSTRMCTKCNR